MAKLLIWGHTTRGQEVIEILEMLGAKNTCNYIGVTPGYAYGINKQGTIDLYMSFPSSPVSLFTLEEFLEKYPFKVGDKVLIPEYESEVRICKMQWDSLCNYVEYMVYCNDNEEWYCAEELLKYNNDFLDDKHFNKKEMKGKIESFEILESYCADEVKIKFDPSKFKMIERKNGYYVVKKQPEYPKTYEECCRILGITYDYPDIKMVSIDECSLYSSFIELIRCRDAYWKMSGDWKPDWESGWENGSTTKYVISQIKNKIELFKAHKYNCVLAFPTAEIRDIFYKNFKELIESCKELL